MLMRQDASSFYAALITAHKIVVAENASSLLPALLHSELLISELFLSELLLSESLFPEQLFPERRG